MRQLFRRRRIRCSVNGFCFSVNIVVRLRQGIIAVGHCQTAMRSERLRRRATDRRALSPSQLQPSPTKTNLPEAITGKIRCSDATLNLGIGSRPFRGRTSSKSRRSAARFDLHLRRPTIPQAVLGIRCNSQPRYEGRPLRGRSRFAADDTIGVRLIRLANLTQAHGRDIVTALGIAMEPYVVKCGTTTIPLEERLRQIGQDRYGAAVRTETGIVAEPGFTRWMAHAITTSRRPRDPAVTLLPRAIGAQPSRLRCLNDRPSGIAAGRRGPLCRTAR